MELIKVKCLCCDREYKAHPQGNACAYSYTPNYGCSECKGVDVKKREALRREEIMLDDLTRHT